MRLVAYLLGTASALVPTTRVTKARQLIVRVETSDYLYDSEYLYVDDAARAPEEPLSQEEASPAAARTIPIPIEELFEDELRKHDRSALRLPKASASPSREARRGALAAGLLRADASSRVSVAGDRVLAAVRTGISELAADARTRDGDRVDGAANALLFGAVVATAGFGFAGGALAANALLWPDNAAAALSRDGGRRLADVCAAV